MPVPLRDARPPSADPAVVVVRVNRMDVGSRVDRPDMLAVEEPLEIRLGTGGAHRTVSVTMRTPGHDPELAVGFLFTEGIISARDQVASARGCRSGNVVRVDLRPGVPVEFDRLERHFYTASSCGVCGKTSLDAVRVQARTCPTPGRPVLDPSIVHRLPDALRAGQAVFDRTGGLHAAALFDPAGTLLAVREDVGRHNALDKLIGAEFLAGRTPLAERILLLSGRVSFELVQKAAVAGVPVVAAVGAPSSLAVELARDRGMTVVGFVRHDRFNVYTGADRIRDEAQP